jgi:hypothetical protein
MSAIVLFEGTPPPIAFLLFGGDEPVAPGSTRDCVFMVLPLPSSSPAAQIVGERKHEEFAVTIASAAGELHISGECRPGEMLDIRFSDERRGSWALTIGSQQYSGACEWAA